MNNSILDISDILEEYSQDIQESITEAAIKIANEGASELKQKSPKKTGKYAKGWKVKITKGKNYINSTIHNNNNWQLTHLLEKPHIIKNSNGTYGTSKPVIHIAPVEEKCVEKFTKEVENIIKNGG